MLTPTEEIALARRIQAGDMDAKRTLIEHNIRLAIHVARRYQHAGLPLEDLVQEAVVGVERAAVKFDPDRGFKFSTYAMWWIRHMIQRALHKDRTTIRVPGHIVERRRKVDRYLLNDPDATNEEIAEALEMPTHHVADARSGPRVVASLDAPLVDDGQSSDWHAIIEDTSAPDPAELVDDTFASLRDAMAQLEPLERDVLRARFGFDNHPYSRDETANLLGVRPHAVQRAQKSGLARLREILGSDFQLED